MPGLELTVPQAVRLWSLGMDDCQHVIQALVDAGFLRWTARRTIVRTCAWPTRPTPDTRWRGSISAVHGCCSPSCCSR